MRSYTVILSNDLLQGMEPPGQEIDSFNDPLSIVHSPLPPMPEMPRMPEKPQLPAQRGEVSAAVPPRKRGRGARMVLGLLAMMLFGGCLAMFYVAAPQLAFVSLIVAAPFGLAAIHYWLWGQSWSQRIHAQVAAEEAAEIAAGLRKPEPELPADEPWLRGEERE